MPLNNTAADALATAICTSLNITDGDAKARWKTIAETLYSALKTDISIVIATDAIGTVGSAAAQSGPQAPVTINPS